MSIGWIWGIALVEFVKALVLEEPMQTYISMAL